MQLHGHTPRHKPLSKQILHYNKHLHHSCWYLKAPCTKLWLLVKIVKQLTGSIIALWLKSPALWSMGFVQDILLPSGTNPIQLETHGTLLSTPFNAHPNPQSPQTYSQHTSTHNHSKTMNRELWCVWLERSM